MRWDGKTGLRLVGIAVALVVFWFQGPGFVRNLRPPRHFLLDFFQEWASARNWWAGAPIYAPQESSAERYLDFQPELSANSLIEHNAHPPTSVLLALPLGRLDYPDAFLAWAVLSLIALGASVFLMVRQCPATLSAWSILPGAALLLLCSPFRQNMNQGQWNLIFLLLITAAWAAARSDRPGWAGVLLGAATAIKLFPGFLFLYFAARRQWRPLVTGSAALLVLTALTAAILGMQCYRDYVTVVLPSLEKYRVWWPNASLAGFWHKLFNSEGSHVIPLWQNPPLAWTLTLVGDGVATLLAGWLTWRGRTRRDGDLAFGATVTAMLLVSPIAWDHYFTILFLPLFLLWVWLPPAGLARLGFGLLMILLWLPPLFYWILFIPGTTISNWGTLIATPRQAATALSVQTYALLALFAFHFGIARGDHRAPRKIHAIVSGEQSIEGRDSSDKGE